MAEKLGTKQFKRTDHEVKLKVDKGEDVQASFAFPDEVVIHIFSYLPLKDRFRLETVCQQWRRCLYYDVDVLVVELSSKNGQYAMELGDVGKKFVSCPEELCRMLEKFQASRVGLLNFILTDNFNDLGVFCMIAGIAANAEQVFVSCFTEYENIANIIDLLDVISPRVTYFHLYLLDCQKLPDVISELTWFHEVFDVLTRIREVTYDFVYSISRMERLKMISTNWPDLIFLALIRVGAEFLPCFEGIELFKGKFCDLSLWQKFRSRYGKQMKTINSESWYLRCAENLTVPPWMDMQPFVNLEDLLINFEGDASSLSRFSEYLEAIAVGCPQLKAFSLRDSDKGTPVYSATETYVMNLFMAIGKIKKLENLYMDVFFRLDYATEADIPLGGNIDLFAILKNGMNIKFLHSDGWFVPAVWSVGQCKIYGLFNQVLPNVEHLYVNCMGSELVNFAGLQKLKDLSLMSYSVENPGVIQSGLICLLKSCPSLISVYVSMELTEITEEFIRAIFEVARQKMEKRMDLSITLCTVSVLNNWEEVWDSCKQSAPRNLNLAFNSKVYDSSDSDDIDSDEEQGNE